MARCFEFMWVLNNIFFLMVHVFKPERYCDITEKASLFLFGHDYSSCNFITQEALKSLKLSLL